MTTNQPLNVGPLFSLNPRVIDIVSTTALGADGSARSRGTCYSLPQRFDIPPRSWRRISPIFSIDMSRRNRNSANAVADMVVLRDGYGASMSSFRSGFQDRFGVGSRNLGVNAGGDARLTASEFYAAIEDSRTAHDKFGFVSGLTEQAVVHRIQDGFGFDAQTGDVDCNKFLNDYIQEWCETPEAFDIAGENDWATSQQYCETAVIRDCDYWYIGLESGHVQLIESHRVRSSNWVRGSSEKGRTDGTTEHLGVICDNRLRRLGVRVFAYLCADVPDAYRDDPPGAFLRFQSRLGELIDDLWLGTFSGIDALAYLQGVDLAFGPQRNTTTFATQGDFIEAILEIDSGVGRK